MILAPGTTFLCTCCCLVHRAQHVHVCAVIVADSCVEVMKLADAVRIEKSAGMI